MLFKPIPYVPGICLQRFFPSERYFAHHRSEILELFCSLSKNPQDNYKPILYGFGPLPIADRMNTLGSIF